MESPSRETVSRPQRFHQAAADLRAYRAALEELIEQKIKAGGKPIAGKKAAPVPATEVIDLVSVLQQSLKQAQADKKKPARHEAKRRKAA